MVSRAALPPVIGAQKVVRFYLGSSAKLESTLSCERTVLNGSPALVLRLTANSTPLWRSVSRMPASPASTTSALRRS